MVALLRIYYELSEVDDETASEGETQVNDDSDESLVTYTSDIDDNEDFEEGDQDDVDDAVEDIHDEEMSDESSYDGVSEECTGDESDREAQPVSKPFCMSFSKFF